MTTPAKTIVIKRQGSAGPYRFVLFDLTINPYATNGCPLVPADVGLTQFVTPPDACAMGGGVAPNWFYYDWTNQKVKSQSQAGETTDNTSAGTAYGVYVMGY
jgi:hypothetical protein